jgi:hypothetical protein
LPSISPRSISRENLVPFSRCAPNLQIPPYAEAKVAYLFSSLRSVAISGILRTFEDGETWRLRFAQFG